MGYEMGSLFSIDDMRRMEIKIKRSTFICTLGHVETVEDAKSFISGVAGEHKNATHNCWAYIVGEKGDIFHSSDSGEPAGTAGRPMLNVLQAHSMSKIAAVVSRYFGGVKLGIRGLIDAYGEAVELAIGMAPLRKIVRTVNYTITLPYAFNDTLIHQLQNFSGKIVNTSYSDMVVHNFMAEEDDEKGTQELENLLSGYRNAGRLDYIRNDNLPET
ncbi:MAG: YigZ family protein [Desulfamplus sp.]|nr:YigZ family protein [Desulfamplus sp.]